MSLPPEQGGLGLAVLIVDTSNKIAGRSKAHSCLQWLAGSICVLAAVHGCENCYKHQLQLLCPTCNSLPHNTGDADECHPCIGFARRLMVPRREQQAAILVQAVQNHNPDVIIVDEIGTRQVTMALSYALKHVLH